MLSRAMLAELATIACITLCCAPPKARPIPACCRPRCATLTMLKGCMAYAAAPLPILIRFAATGLAAGVDCRVYRGAPAFSGKVDSGMAGSKGSSRTQPFTQSLPGQSGSRLQLLSVGGTCEIERAEFHETRSIWLRGQVSITWLTCLRLGTFCPCCQG